MKLIAYNKAKNRNIEIEIIMDESRKRYTYKNDKEGIDITIIEIKPNKDKIKLECEKKSIYLLHYPKEKKLVSFGLINGINQSEKINHYCNTKDGSSGCPILSLNIRLNYGT